MVAEAENPKSLGVQYGRSFRVGPFSFGREVLAAVEFDDEFGGMANEIGDIVLDWGLATESSPA